MLVPEDYPHISGLSKGFRFGRAVDYYSGAALRHSEAIWR